MMRFSDSNRHCWLPGIFSISIFIAGLRAESPLQAVPSIETILRVPASRFQSQSPEQLSVDLRRGIGPDDAATIALYSNPALRAIRDRRRLASAQVIQAGILPNPGRSSARHFVTGGNTAGTGAPSNLTSAWEFTAFIPV